MENLVESGRVSVKPEARIQSAYKGKKVCVTGHTGFKGAWLCEWLLNLGAEVAGFSLVEPVATPSLFEQLGLGERLKDTRGDVRDRQAVVDWMVREEPDFIFHLAAQPLVRLSYREPVMTWETNVLGTIHVLEGLRTLARPCAAVLITTDKVYENREWLYGYREVDPLGGHDPYSASKAATEIAIACWRDSFFRDHPVRLASARAGNVIGGGDWAEDRIVPDLVRALQAGRPVPVRNKRSTRPWQHVLEPLSGYLRLAALLAAERVTSAEETSPNDTSLNHSPAELCSAFNFGPHLESNQTVQRLVEEALKHWQGTWQDCSDPQAPHEAGKLNLAWDKACHVLGWSPRWGFAETVEKTIAWYRAAAQGADPAELTRHQIAEYSRR